MATQGMIVIKEDGKVKFKIIAGDNGFNIHNIPRAELITDSPTELYTVAQRHNVGCADCLIVSYLGDSNEVRHFHLDMNLDHESNPWYWDQFFNPDFNPRWKNGGVDHLRTINVSEEDV
jgi:hypothetical protein